MIIVKRFTLILLLATLLCISLQANDYDNFEASNEDTITSTEEAYGSLPLYFEQNIGQNDDIVSYSAQAGSYTLFLTPRRIVFDLMLAAATEDQAGQSYGLYMDFTGANAESVITGETQQEGISSYFTGDEAEWISDVPHYSKVRYENLYDGIDAIFYGNQRQLQYDFIVAPGADPAQIQLQFNPAEHITLDENGNLNLHISDQIMTMHAPFTYQMINNEKHEISSRFMLEGDTVYFMLGNYDSELPLIIDPLIYSTYLGGAGIDQVESMVIDNSGNAYLTGETRSPDFPTTPGTYDTVYAGNMDAFITKLNAAGTGLIYSTYLGGSQYDRGHSIAIDGAGNAYITGGTGSSDFPTTAGAFNTVSNGSNDAFITKINAAGTALIFSTYIGGNEREQGFKLALDTGNNVYITGDTQSSNFPITPGAYQTVINEDLPGAGDAFLVKLNAAGTALVYSTYLGGGSYERIQGITVDGAGNAYVTGYTASTNFPTTAGAFARTKAGGVVDIFITKFNAAGNTLLYSTYLGGSSYDYGYDIAIDNSGNAYIVGSTSSLDFPITAGAVDNALTGIYSDAYVTKINPSGTALIYSTYLGGNLIERGHDILVDNAGNAYITGTTHSADFPITPGVYDTTFNGGHDIFVSILDAVGSNMMYSTFIGGSGFEHGDAFARDASGSLYIAGFTSSSNYPTTAGAFNVTTNPGEDGYITKLNPVVLQAITLAFDSPSSAAPEATGAGNILRVTTSDNQPTSRATTITVNTTGGTATNADYNLTGTITIPAGTAHNALVSIASGFTITDDNIEEVDETVQLTLSAPVGATLGIQTTHTHTIQNDDIAGVTITPGSGVVGEGNSLTYTVVLRSPPANPVTITPTTASLETAISPGSLTFNSSNWNIPQSITLSVADNALADGSRTATITHTVTSTDAVYDTIGISNYTLSISDDETAGVTFSALELIEDGVSGIYRVVLNTQPSNTVTISLITPDAECTISTATPLTFTTGDWNIPQDITATAVIDTDVEGIHSCTLIHAFNSTDTDYAGNFNHTITIKDNNPNLPDSAVDDAVSSDEVPQIEIFDPALSKLGELLPGQLGIMGERLRWIITVRNIGGVNGTGVVFTDTVRDELQIDNVTTTKGTISITDQTVIVNIGNLAPGESVGIVIETTVLRSNVEINNTACVTGLDTATECITSDSYQGIHIDTLPVTGETPLWRISLFALLTGVIIGFCILKIRSSQTVNS